MSLVPSNPLADFHPAVAAWFGRRFGEPTAPQRLAWPAIRGGGHALVAAPTGSGKTLAAFLSAIDALVRRGLDEGLSDAVEVVYVSPLKALSNDIQKNLEEPLAGIRAELLARGLPPLEIRALLRTGDTPSAARTAMLRRPPHILVTTPESLYVLLTSDGGRRLLATTRTVIVDEIHAVAGDKRGSHLALSLARLEDLVERNGGSLARIGLSATQKPIEDVARLLVGRDAQGHPRPCTIVDVGHTRHLDLAIEIPRSPLGAITPNEVSSEVYDRLAELVRSHETTLIFANTRRQAERVARHLEERVAESQVAGAERPCPNGHGEIAEFQAGAERPCPNGHDEIKIAAHHGSLSRERRLAIEDRLKRGELRALVATSSLELGIDIGSIDLVCQLGSTRTIATLLQRAGRAGHSVGGLPKARLFPLTLGELGDCAALLRSVRRGELDRLRIPEAPLDILAQQIVAEVAAGERGEDELFQVFTRAEPFARVPRETFDRLIDDLTSGAKASVEASPPRTRGAHLHRDVVQGVLRPRRGARLAAITSGGAIPDNAEFQVVLEPQGVVIGSVHEDFAAESLAGDVFLLGSASWRIQKIEQSRVLVEDARGQAPGLPFWFGEAPARSPELSESLCDLREIAIEIFRAHGLGSEDVLVERFATETGIDVEAARQLVAQYAEGFSELGTLPTRKILVAERFFDDAGDQHLVLHAPFGSRINRAWGLALRKRFCRTFNFELQAAADEDSVVLSLGPTHSFPLEDVFRFLASGTARDVLIQALLDAPMFGIRWRWNAARSLAIPRFRGGKRVPPFFQRQLAEDLAAVLFPDQLACLENIAGDREIPDHPLVAQTIHDCLTESMDVDGLEAVLRGIERGEIECVARDLPTPSVFAEAILHAQPYAFLDDAPLEERRTQSVRRRRRVAGDPALAGVWGESGTLDGAAIARVEDEVWPVVESADELADALAISGFLTDHEGLSSGWGSFFGELVRAGRAARVLAPPGEDVWIAIERAAEHRALKPQRPIDPELPSIPRLEKSWTEEGAAVEILRSRLAISGPRTARELGAPLGLSPAATTSALAVLEAEGVAFRGHFRPAREVGDLEWCDRRILARIHRQMLETRRREIEPVTPADFSRFLFEWQRVSRDARGRGSEALAATLAQLEGFTAAAAAWEESILPARLADYEPEALDALCFGGRLVWCRATPPTSNGVGRGGPVRATPTALLPRAHTALWLVREGAEVPPSEPEALGSSEAEAVRAALGARGASFASELAAATGLLPNQVERGLGILVAAGLATADGFSGLRALIGPSAGMDARVRAKVDRLRRHASGFGRDGVPSAVERAGRWSLLAAPSALSSVERDERADHAARALLARWGVVFRRLVEREALLPPWREILPVLRRLEARGEIRGGRFVEGFSGEQYALPEAIATLRRVRKTPKSGEWIAISAADPLNLIFLLAPNERVAATLPGRILFRDGLPIAVREGKEIRFLVDLEPAERWQAETTLRRLGPATIPPMLASAPA